MYLRKVEESRPEKGKVGDLMTLADLPSANTKRWVASRKAAVVRGIETGLISREDAKRRWMLSDEELAEWENAIDRHGIGALKVTAVQKYRQS